MFTLPTFLFSYNKETRTFATEMSTIDANTFKFKLERVYSDACDVGFRLVSHVTGTELIFVLEEEERNSEGEMTAWSFSLKTEDGRKRPELKDLKVIIFND